MIANRSTTGGRLERAFSRVQHDEGQASLRERYLLGEPELGVVSISGIHGGRWACAMPKSVRQAGWLCLLFVSAVDELSF